MVDLGGTTNGIVALRHRLRPALLRWAVGVFCALVGALMLIAPHQFAGASFAPLRPWLTEWGAAFFAAGVALIATSAVGTRGQLAVASSVSAAGALLALAGSFLFSGGATGVVVYTVFGLATLLSPLVDQSSTPGEDGVDLFVLAAALAAVGNGLVLLFGPGSTVNPIYDAFSLPISPYALLFLLGGGGVLVSRLWQRTSRLGRSVTQVILGVAFLAFLLASALPNRIWTGLLFYGGVGTLLIVGPWLSRYARRVDSSSLRVRLALAMASAAAIPLLFVAAVATGWEEQAAVDQQLALQQALAGGLAADVDGALTQHHVGLVLVAEYPMLLSGSPPGDRRLLGDVGEVAPGLVALGTFDTAGRPAIVLGGDDANTQTRLSTMAGEALRRTRPGQAPPGAFLMTGERPTVVLAAPIRQPGGGMGGIAVGELDRAWLRQRLERGIAGAPLSAIVVDEAGAVVVAAGEPISVGGDPAGHPSVRRFRDASAARGTVRFAHGSREYLAGFARIPGSDWAVVVEQPTSTALATVWASRELTFVVLLGAFIAASALGVALANRLAAPLALLAHAAQSIAIGGPATLLPRSRLYEVRVVARAFARMQARLAARTAERERAEKRLRTLAHASAELTRSLDETEIVTALGTIVVDQLADWCSVEMLDDDRQVRRVLVHHRDSDQQSSLDELPPILGSELARPALAGESVLLPDVTAQDVIGPATADGPRRALERLGTRSLLVVPLRVRDQTLGALSCVYGVSGRRYGREDLPLARELALRAALAIDNARLYAAERTARAEAEAAVRVREEFLAIAAHELKTPVTSLRGFADLGVRALDAQGTLDAALARRTLETIERQSARLSTLVANLLEVARGSAERNAIVPRRVNLAELARIVVEAARVRAQHHLIRLEATDSVEATVDPLRIEQVLTNLVDNAVKYSPTGSPIEVTVTAGPDGAELVIRDHGMGIPPEHRDRIFDRFFQAHVGEHASGMGLGLYISHQIVRHHGGTIRVESPADGGTRMIVSLPRELPQDLTPEPVAPSGQRSA